MEYKVTVHVTSGNEGFVSFDHSATMWARDADTAEFLGAILANEVRQQFSFAVDVAHVSTVICDVS
jgi:hypothetical protein